ncbi:MAG: RNA 2',3'-cyclic phosphodiesterase [Desulfotignum sp.]|nr:RNA 2',3'-cyclic phosphodiesterase [Desulfotignum sp.]MCF8112879.1 RNA 2',3'-cyclic phosphodiesterase [Desulfotignum sp.]MCF8125983.1 RNA 2',3'-cyclic phosphodiesterase [Desulfotignum sp.]
MGDRPDKIRAFIAIPLPGHVRQTLGDIQSEIRRSGIKAAWPDPARFHLTLKFLGCTRDETLVLVKTTMEKFAGRCPKLSLTAGSIGVFPGNRGARVIWADISGQTQPLSQLFQELDKELHAIGIPRQVRRFSPHITLARIKEPVSAKNLIDLTERFKNRWTDQFQATCLALYKSRLTPLGAVHTRLFHVKLTL